MHITFTSAKQAKKSEPTLALKPRVQTRGNSGPKIGTYVSAKNFLKKYDAILR